LVSGGNPRISDAKRYLAAPTLKRHSFSLGYVGTPAQGCFTYPGERSALAAA
jgi:hypothetical protein